MSDEQLVEAPATPQPPAGQPQRIVVVSTKSIGLAIALAFFFGPLGMLYSTIMGAVVMFFVCIPVVIFTAGFGLLLTIPACTIWAYLAAKSHNEKLLAGHTP